MIEALYISENALRGHQAWIDTISHNVANMNTSAYKRTDVQFADMVGVGPHSVAGMGSIISDVQTDFTLGKFKQTQRQLDFAIAGEGFLEVILANGELAYTRNAQLAINEDRRLVLFDGTELAVDVFIPEDAQAIEIRRDGRVVVGLPGGLAPVEVGQLTLVKFANASALKGIGSGHFIASSNSGEPEPAVPGESGMGELIQGSVEMSNVELVKEMTDVVLAQRAYQLNARLLQVTDQVLETINNLRR